MSIAGGSAIARLSDHEIENLLGEDALKRLKARARGGANAYKGQSYEEIFSSHKIAKLARNYIEAGIDANAEWQSDAFVDDFVIRQDTEKSFKGYQLKNSPNVGWEIGSSPIKVDFQNQFQCSNQEGYTDVNLRLVCSDMECVKTLTASIPEEIKDYAKAVHFPYKEKFVDLLEENQWVADDFGWLSKFPNPKKLDMHQVAAILIGAWRLLAPTATISSVLEQARDMSPMLVRSLRNDANAEAQLKPECREILNSLPEFNFTIERGFLHWSYSNDLMKGVLSQDCFSPAFEAFQNSIMRINPTSFEDIEGELV